ncbi:MAG TPA: hypothetical protein VHL53_07715 [Acidimicrobiia bacterium]|nr:hypothetical protein [Acidimicrobiia bacterium]
MTGPARRAVAVVAAATAVLLPAALAVTPARAQQPQTQLRVEASKKIATGAITRRVLALRELSTAAKSIVRLSDADRTALTTQLQDQINGLTSLNAKIQGDTDEAQLKSDAGKIITDYHVYVLMIPKARGIVVADIEMNAEDRLAQLADRLESTIDQASGKDTTKARSDLAALRAKLTTVTTSVTPLPGALLALAPSGYPGNRPTLETTRTTLRTGRQALNDAATLARTVLADLK